MDTLPTDPVDDITTSVASSVADLIDLERDLYMINLDDKKSSRAFPPLTAWAFRGQPREYRNLCPSSQRQFQRQSFKTAESIERRLLVAFREHYAELQDRSSDMPDPTRIGPDYDLRCLSVMQHYEIPTRLLDWTSNFWIAVYFACAGESEHNGELWIYDRALFTFQRKDKVLKSLLDSSDNPPPELHVAGTEGFKNIFELDPKLTPRMLQQAAHHTVSSDVFADHAEPLFSLCKKASATRVHRIPFRRVVIANGLKWKALQFLADELQVTARSIFPDFVGLGRFLRWQFESLRTLML